MTSLAGPSEAMDGRGERTGMYSQRVPPGRSFTTRPAPHPATRTPTTINPCPPPPTSTATSCPHSARQYDRRPSSQATPHQRAPVQKRFHQGGDLVVVLVVPGGSCRSVR